VGTAVVTGASSGLGRAIASRLADRGVPVIAVARSASSLHELAASSPRITVVPADLSTTEGRDAVFEVAGEVDILVNNAGFGASGRFADLAVTLSDQMVEVNVVTVTDLTGRWLPGMVRRGSGRILNIASTAAFQPGPNMAVYAATKSFVLSFTEGIAEELRGTGVTATAFCPGPFRSGFQQAAGLEHSRLFNRRSLPDSDEMARAALAAMDRGSVVAVPGGFNKAGAFATRLAPRLVVRRMVQWVQSVE
jgi:short-subunit dehydrogenase